MRVLIDADGCPVVDVAVKLCVKTGVECLILCDTAHQFEKAGATTLTFEKGADSVDFALANKIKAEDIAVTQDYGLAAMCLARGAQVLNQDGVAYTADNIESLLQQRHVGNQLRRAGVRTKGPPKRTAGQNKQFEQALEKMLTGGR